MVSDVSRYQSNNITYQREPQRTSEVQRQQNQEPEQRRADSIENRRQSTLSYLGGNIDTYA